MHKMKGYHAVKKFSSIFNFINIKITNPIKKHYNDYCNNSPLRQNNNLYSKLTINRYKILTLDTLFIYPVITFLLLLPILYNKTGWDYVEKHFQISQIINQIIKAINMNKLEFQSLLQLLLYIFICCCLAYLIVIIIFINKINFIVDFIKLISTFILPIFLFIWWGNGIFKLIKNLPFSKNNLLFSLIILFIIIINYVFSKIFEYINSYSSDESNIINDWKDSLKYGWKFPKPRYFLLGYFVPFFIFYLPYVFSSLRNQWICILLLILCSLLLVRNTILLEWSRVSVNNLIVDILGMITLSTTTSFNIIYLELYVCFVLALYLTEQVEGWFERIHTGFNKLNSKEKKYILDNTNTFLNKFASNYGIAGSILILAIAILESIFHIH